jgi:hypothetical protein
LFSLKTNRGYCVSLLLDPGFTGLVVSMGAGLPPIACYEGRCSLQKSGVTASRLSFELSISLVMASTTHFSFRCRCYLLTISKFRRRQTMARWSKEKCGLLRKFSLLH